MEPLKYMYNDAFFEDLEKALGQYATSFKKETFRQLIYNENWDSYELKERMHHIAITLDDVLTGSYADKIDVLKKVAKAVEQYKFEQMFFPDFVATFGMDETNLNLSIEALAYFTPFCSSEFAVRPFIVKYEDRLIPQLLQWAEDENYHIRRLASEGCRPRLPWAMALPKYKKDPSPILPILEKLKTDPTDYVRRSVANNLNDIAKDHPDLVLDIGKRWKGISKETDWVVKHGLRTLLKKGNTTALMLFGFGNPSKISVSNLAMNDLVIKIGTDTRFSFDLKSEEPKPIKLRLEYAIYFKKANGSWSKKIFQISENTFEPNKIYTYNRKQHFKNLTTRKHYTGDHRLAIIVNGIEKAEIDFELV